VPEEYSERLLALALAAAATAPIEVRVDVNRLEVVSAAGTARFSLSERHRRMFMEGLDMLGASLLHRPAIEAFARRWQEDKPWLKDVAAKARSRLDQAA
jgi:3-isopropylmalate/(R)-2-methylmalate dehydratase small subunit